MKFNDTLVPSPLRERVRVRVRHAGAKFGIVGPPLTPPWQGGGPIDGDNSVALEQAKW